ncbi:MAG: DUF58 domain-containing protein [Fimbriimonadales bacterium]|nr:DUF58 domain-containing protein [Fimbriimonadales bacterium]
MIFRWRFFALLSIAIVIAILGSFDSSLFAFIWPLNIAVFGLALVAYALAPSGRDLRIERKYDRVLSVRVPNLIRLRVTNEGNQRIRFRLRDEPPAEFSVDVQEFDLDLEPGQSKELRYHVTPAERGDYFFRDSFMRADGPLGIVARQSRLRTREIVRVYPNVLALRKFDLLKQRGHLRQIGIRRSRLKGVGTDFDALRDYASGDDFRKIDWKATARRGKLIVKEFEAERNQPVILVVDYGRLMMADVGNIEKLDYVLDAALMLGNAASTANDQIGLLIYADRVERWIPPKRGRGQLGVVIEALHALRAEPIEPNAKDSFNYLATRWKRRSLMVVFTELEDSDAAKRLLTVLGPLARRHICLVVSVADPALHAQRHAALDEPLGPYLRTSANLYHEEREGAQRLLNAAGVRTLDSEPETLATDLVNYYLDIKATQQL